jgi:very-short-patch-repair endonuclease
MWNLLVQFWPFAVLAAVLYLLLNLGRVLLPEEQLPYEKRRALFTQSERKFFMALQQATGTQWEIFGMVRLADLIRVRSKTPKFQGWQNRIHAKHIDFVLCDPQSLEVKLAVELDDATHQRAERQARDAFVEAALEASELPLLRVPVAPDYDIQQLRKALHDAMNSTRTKRIPS